MAYYVKVKPEVRDRILPHYIKGTKSADGNIILFQSDLNGVPGLTLSDRAAAVGGALLTPIEAKMEMSGTCADFARCYDPEAVVEEEVKEGTTEETKEETVEKEESTEATETPTEETTDEEEAPAEESTEKTTETTEEEVEETPTEEETATEENTDNATEESEVNNG